LRRIRTGPSVRAPKPISPFRPRAPIANHDVSAFAIARPRFTATFVKMPSLFSKLSAATHDAFRGSPLPDGGPSHVSPMIQTPASSLEEVVSPLPRLGRDEIQLLTSSSSQPTPPPGSTAAGKPRSLRIRCSVILDRQMPRSTRSLYRRMRTMVTSHYRRFTAARVRCNMRSRLL
jgi:hypothetical protein